MGGRGMMRRYSFEIMLSLVLLCGLITLSFFL
ncbi:small membrane protein YdgU [Pectobacterium carotovorum]